MLFSLEARRLFLAADAAARWRNISQRAKKNVATPLDLFRSLALSQGQKFRGVIFLCGAIVIVSIKFSWR